MELTVFRWSAALGLSCGAIAVAASPLATYPKVVARSAETAAYNAAIDRARTVSSIEVRALADHRAAAGITRWRATVPATDTARLHVERSGPTALGDSLTAVLEREWSALGTGASGARATAFVYLDTAPAPVRALRESRRSVDVFQVLPEASGRRCLTLIRVRDTTAAVVTSALPESVLGVCGFYARFGQPGAPVRAWLGATAFAAARSSAWSSPTPSAVRGAQTWLDLPSDAGRCLARGGRPCLDALGIGSPDDITGERPAARGAVAGSMPSVLAPPETYAGTLGGDRWFFADVVRAIGPEKFAAFWTTTMPVSEAFSVVTGVPLDAFMRQWLERMVGQPAGQPRVHARAALWLAVALPLLVVAPSRRRNIAIGGRG